MRALASTLIAAALLIAPWAAPASQAATDTVAPGQYGYVPNRIPDSSGSGVIIVRDPKALPPSTRDAQRALKDLNDSKLPSNRPTDVVKAAAAVKGQSAN
jgi:hypothetical protein